MRSSRTWLLTLLALPAVSSPAAPLFESSDVVDVTLTGPLHTLIKQMDQREEHAFVIRAQGAELEVNVRTRGKSRLRVCKFPPLRLNFKKSQTTDGLFMGQDKLKLVTHCRNHDKAEVDMLQEYAAYRIFNLITHQSYRVRQFRIHYDDTDERLPEDAEYRFGFVVESNDELAARLGWNPAELATVNRRTLDPQHAALAFVFQYLVGNTDWALVTAEDAEYCCHNGDLFQRDTRVFFMPYDFDLTGVVNANYAFPDRSLRIKRVTQRLYRGMCMDRSVLEEALNHVVSLREAVLAVPGSIVGLPEKQSASTRDYLERFFVEAEDQEALLAKFERHCIEPRVRPKNNTAN